MSGSEVYEELMAGQIWQVAGFAEEDLNGDGPHDVGEQPACARCLGPAGDVPLRVWLTTNSADVVDEEEVQDEWVVCWSCIKKSGKPLEQLMAELAGGRVEGVSDVP